MFSQGLDEAETDGRPMVVRSADLGGVDRCGPVPDVAAAVHVFHYLQLWHRIGVIPPDRFQQTLESFPVRSIAKLLFIEVGKTGVEGENLIMLPTALVARIARREFKIIVIVSLWEASLWRDMVY